MKALKISVIGKAYQVLNEGRIMLRKMTVMSDYYNRFDTNENYCSYLHFGPHCQALQYQVRGGLLALFGFQRPTTVTVSYNAQTQDIVRIYTKGILLDLNYVIIRQKLSKMERISKQNEVTIVKSIPSSLNEDYGVELVVVAMASHKRWIIVRTCDSRITWVDVVIPSNNDDHTELLKTLDEEIDAELKKLGIEPSTLMDVPLDLPFIPPKPAIGSALSLGRWP